MQPVRLVTTDARGQTTGEVVVGVSSAGRVWMLRQTAAASEQWALDAAQANLLGRALLQAATEVTVKVAA